MDRTGSRRRPPVRFLVAAYWFGLTSFLAFASIVGVGCSQRSEEGDQCGGYDAGTWPSKALVVLPALAFIAGIVALKRPARLQRLLAYGIHAVLTALVIWLVSLFLID